VQLRSQAKAANRFGKSRHPFAVALADRLQQRRWAERSAVEGKATERRVRQELGASAAAGALTAAQINADLVAEETQHAVEAYRGVSSAAS
jgi:hypothetical protein